VPKDRWGAVFSIRHGFLDVIQRYTQFREIYRRRLSWHRVTTRPHHRAGEKFFVDSWGKKPCCMDPTSGEAVFVELFVGVWGASGVLSRKLLP